MLCSDFQKFCVTATATDDLKTWGHRTSWRDFDQVHSSLFFHRLIVVNNTIILLKMLSSKTVLQLY